MLIRASLDNGDVDSRERQLTREHQSCRTPASDHHRMLYHPHTPGFL
jgi:hypothetical protein